MGPTTPHGSAISVVVLARFDGGCSARLRQCRVEYRGLGQKCLQLIFSVLALGISDEWEAEIFNRVPGQIAHTAEYRTERGESGFGVFPICVA